MTIYLLLLCAAAYAGLMYFRYAQDIDFKKKWWVWFNVGFGAAFCSYFVYRGVTENTGNQSMLIVVGIIVLVAISIKTTRFCSQCSMMEIRRRTWFSKGHFCRRCGTDLSTPT